MADDADIAGDRAEIELAARLASVRAELPAGVAGKCDECGEFMRRLVGGQCGFCRDGRRPPLEIYDRLDGAPETKPVLAKETTMPATQPAITSRKIAISGLAMGAVENRAEANDITYQQAATDLIELGAKRASAECPAANLAELSTSEILAELDRRIASSAETELLNSALTDAIARAESAEGKLAAVTIALGAAAC